MNKDELMKKLSRLESDNQHTLYMKEIALYCDDYKTAQKFELINQIQDLEGYLNSYLSLYRDYLFNILRINNSEKCRELNLYIPESKTESFPKIVYDLDKAF